MGRAQKYAAKVDAETIGKKYDATKDLAVRKQTKYFGDAVKLENRVKSIADGEPSFLQHFYIAYAEELVKKKTEVEWEIIYQKWCARGLNCPLLVSLGEELIGFDPSGVPPAPPSPLLTNLVAYYKLDDDAANTFVDDETNNSEGDLEGGETTAGVSVAGILNKAFGLDGNDAVNIGLQGNLGSNLGNGLSISFWIKTVQATQGALTGINMAPSSQTFGFYINRKFDLGVDAGKLTIVLRDVDNNLFVAGTTNDENFRDGAWHHIVMTVDGPNKLVTIYVDNGSKPITIGFNNLADNFINFTFDNYVGAENNAGAVTSYITGDLDEFGMWNRILDAGDVADLWNGSIGITYPF